MAKDSSSAVVLKLTVHSLLSCWEPDTNLISHDHVTSHQMRHTDEDDTAHLPLTRPSIVQLIGTDSQLSFSSATFGVCKNILSLLHVISGAVTYVSLHLKQQNCCWGYTIKSHDVGETWRMSVKQHGRNTHTHTHTCLMAPFPELCR